MPVIFRTIKINTSDVYDLVAEIETYIAQIANYAKGALNDPESRGTNPIRTFSRA